MDSVLEKRIVEIVGMLKESNKMSDYEAYNTAINMITANNKILVNEKLIEELNEIKQLLYSFINKK